MRKEKKYVFCKDATLKAKELKNAAWARVRLQQPLQYLTPIVDEPRIIVLYNSKQHTADLDEQGIK